MALYQAGDEMAFEILYNRHAGKVCGFLQRRTNQQNAHELTQETFFKLHRARHQYSSKYPLLPWLFTIARNTLYDFERLGETKTSHRSTSEIEAPPDHSPDKSDGLSLDLQKLPEAQRLAIELRYLKDWSFEKIAAELRTSPLNARQLISRGVKKLRSRFGGKSS